MESNKRERENYSQLFSLSPIFKTPAYKKQRGLDDSLEFADTFKNMLHTAIKNNDTDKKIDEILADPYLDINQRNQDGQTALHLAVMQGKLAILEKILAKDALTSITDYQGDTPLDYAIIYNQMAALNLLLNSRTDTPLHKAISLAKKEDDDHAKIAEVLTNDPNTAHDARNKNLVTPLHLTAFIGLPSLFNKLIEKGADIFAADKDDFNALFYAAYQCQNYTEFKNAKQQIIKRFPKEPIINFLLGKYDKKIYMPNKNFFTLFIYTIETSGVDGLKALLQMTKLNINELDYLYEYSSLHYAALLNNQKAIEGLINTGAFVTITSKNSQETLLHCLARSQNAAVTHLIDLPDQSSTNSTTLQQPDDVEKTHIAIAAYTIAHISNKKELKKFLQQKDK